MKRIEVTKLEILNPWLKFMSSENRNKILDEIECQHRAVDSVKKDNVPQRIARRIVERSKQRISKIMTGEMVRR